MRIAIFTELYAPSVGGQEMFFAGLSKALLKRGHQIDLHCIAHAKGLAEQETIDGVRIVRHPVAPRYTNPFIRSMRRDWLAIASYSRHIRAVAKRDEHDVYLLNQWPFMHALALPNRARERAMLHWCEIRQGAPYRLAQSRLPNLVAMNAAISDTVGAEIAKFTQNQVLTLPSGLDLTHAQWRPRDERSGIVVLGRIAPHKNIGLLIAAFEEITKGGYQGDLVIAGDGPAATEVRERAAASPVSARIVLPGFVSDDEKFRLLANSEILAMPSMREGFPHVVSEAMSCGTPIVTADYVENGTKDIVSRFGSGVVTAPTVESFARGILDTLSDWERFSTAGRGVAANLDWDGIAQSFEKAIVENLESRYSKAVTARQFGIR